MECVSIKDYQHPKEKYVSIKLGKKCLKNCQTKKKRKTTKFVVINIKKNHIKHLYPAHFNIVEHEHPS